jgi:hypothetical protein
VYELNKFKKFIHSPYFNVNDSLTELFAALEPFLKNKKEVEKLSKEDTYKLLFQNEIYSDKKFRKLSSDLLKLAESFLALQVYEQNPLHKANYLLESISKKQITKLYNTAINTARRLSSQQLEKSSSFYYYQYQIEKNLFNLTTEFEKKASSKSTLSQFNVTDIANNLDLFFLAEKIKYYITLLSWKSIIKHDYKLMFIDEVISQIEKLDIKDIPPLAIYYQIYLSIKDPDNKEHYFNLKGLIEKHINQFPLSEAKDIYDSAFNYCIAKINRGEEVFSKELLELYSSSLDNGALYINGELSPTSFRNICFISLRLGNYEWTEKFINDFKHKINPKFRENAVTFNLARLNFYRKDYEKVISLLQDVEYEDMIYNLNSKTILLAVYYELDEIDVLDSFIESFNAFVVRKKSVPVQRRDHYLRLLKYTKKLSRLFPGDKKEIEKIIKELESTTGIVNKQWLLSKAKELYGSYKKTAS